MMIQIQFIGHEVEVHVHSLYLQIHAHVYMHIPHMHTMHTNSHKCLSCYDIHNILEL